MSAEVRGNPVGQALRWQPPLGALPRKEAVRILRSPAFPILSAYLLLIGGLQLFGAGEDAAGTSIPIREDALNGLAYFTLLLLGPITFVAANLVATSSRRSGSDELLAAAPVSQRRRDLGLCLAVIAGPVLVALALSGGITWLASGVELTSSDGLTVYTVSWIDMAQIPAIVLGAGILAIVVARWLPFPGAPVLGLFVLVIGTGWLVADGGDRAIRPWFSPYVVMTWWSDEGWHPSASPVWHLVYLIALSWLGACVVALRQPERRRRWLTVGAAALMAVVTAGLLQLPS